MNNEDRAAGKAYVPEWLTAEQAREMIGISVPTLRRWLKAGRLPGAQRHGGRWRVHFATLVRALESGLAPGRPVAGEVPIRGRPSPEGRDSASDADRKE